MLLFFGYGFALKVVIDEKVGLNSFNWLFFYIHSVSIYMEFETYGRVSIGVIKSDRRAIVIDSGIDENDIRKVLNKLNEEGYTVDGVYLTHSHSDHSGGAFFAVKRGINVYSSRIEADLIMNPSILNVMISGFYNYEFARSKFVTPERSKILYVENQVNFGNESVKVIDLKGHTLGQVGYQADEIMFAGDSLFSIETLEKHPIPYVLDVPMYLQTLERLKSFTGKIIVSHMGLLEDNLKTINFNIDRIKEIKDVFWDISSNGRTIDEVIRAILNRFNSNRHVLNYFLDATTIKSIIFSYGIISYRDGTLMVEPKR